MELHCRALEVSVVEKFAVWSLGIPSKDNHNLESLNSKTRQYHLTMLLRPIWNEQLTMGHVVRAFHHGFFKSTISWSLMGSATISCKMEVLHEALVMSRALTNWEYMLLWLVLKNATWGNHLPQDWNGYDGDIVVLQCDMVTGIWWRQFNLWTWKGFQLVLHI